MTRYTYKPQINQCLQPGSSRLTRGGMEWWCLMRTGKNGPPPEFQRDERVGCDFFLALIDCALTFAPNSRDDIAVNTCVVSSYGLLFSNYVVSRFSWRISIYAELLYFYFYLPHIYDFWIMFQHVPLLIIASHLHAMTESFLLFHRLLIVTVQSTNLRLLNLV